MIEVTTSNHLMENYEHYYDEGDSEWRRIGATGKAENIVSLCRDLPHSSILEIGAGEGSILARLSELRFGDELYALEVSPSGVETIKRKGIARLVSCGLFDGYRIPFADDRFNLAILSHVIEHVEYPRQLLYEASRVAKHVFIEVSLEDTVRLPKDFTFNKVGHINFYSPATFRQLVQSCNLDVLKQLVTNPPQGSYTYEKGIKGLWNYFVKKSLLRVAPQVAPYLFTYHGALVCKRSSG
jgi:ubiquinone/menaquinone biosynthesis C-methylase UbiE